MLVLSTDAAQGQRTDDNAITTATDAFGTTVGAQSIGLYSETSARGFNPAKANNLRIEGLFFDQQTSMSNPYLFDVTAIRVGVAAQSFAFPSPSGIADKSLRVPGRAPALSAVAMAGPLTTRSVEVDGQTPLFGDTVAARIVLASDHDWNYNFARHSRRDAVSFIGEVRPSESTELIPFFGYHRNVEREEVPVAVADGINPLPMYDHRRLSRQDWTRWNWNELTAGLIGRSKLSDHWTVAGGLFRSRQKEQRTDSEMLLGLSRDRTAVHLIDVSPGRFAGSYSGDLRLTHRGGTARHQRELTLSVRGRRVDRRFGGDSIADFGLVSIDDLAPLPEPTHVFSEQSRDRVRQIGVGVSDIERWGERLAISAGVLVTRYSRTVTMPDQPRFGDRTTAVLPTLGVTFSPMKDIGIYASYTHGLEDAPTAPPSAVNRGEPPPATPTWQIDAGVTTVLPAEIRLLLGVFKIKKSYFNVDDSGVYGNLGSISSTGIEGSANWSALPGLTVVAGGVWMRPKVRRPLSGTSGDRFTPIGPVPGTVSAYVDYEPSQWGGWGASFEWAWWSARVQTFDGRDKLPDYSTVKLGIRYRSTLAGRPWSLRLDVANIAGTRALTLTPEYAVTPIIDTNCTLTFAIDVI